MPNHSAVAIANEFLRISRDISHDQMKLQKLVYLSHGWNLAINDEPLVRDPIEAWDGGPVFRSLWDHIRYYGYGIKSKLLVDPRTREPLREDLSEDERGILRHVWKKYGKYTGEELSVMTHKSGTPWFKSYIQGRNTQISNQVIRQHYQALAHAGRAARTARAS